jgi:hypothetical protein
LKAGWWVTAMVKEGIASLRCYVGQIQAIDERGRGPTLVDWLLGSACSCDLFISHTNLEAPMSPRMGMTSKDSAIT